MTRGVEIAVEGLVVPLWVSFSGALIAVWMVVATRRSKGGAWVMSPLSAHPEMPRNPYAHGS